LIIQARSQKVLIDHILSRGEGIYISLSITSYHSLKIFRKTQRDKNEYYFLDGQGAVFCENIRVGSFVYKKLPGCEAWLRLIEELDSQNIAIIGATEKVNNKTKLILEQKYKNIKVPVSIHGYQNLDPDDIVTQLKKYNVKYVFLGLGQPDQEWLSRELLQKHPAVYMPLGGSFDVLSGSSSRAPRLYQILMLEWLYRIFTKRNKAQNFASLFKGIFNAFNLHF
jgi:exopolysaccharide biosynthesis WecB/TagA/CpsF family protein